MDLNPIHNSYTDFVIGNVINDGTHSYSYDAEGRIATVDGGGTATYVYDASGRRVRKISGIAVDYVYDLGGHVISEFSASGNWNRGEVYAGGQHVATYDNTNDATYFTHADWLGTERVRSTVLGAVLPGSPWTSFPFGEGSAAPNPGPTHFTGKERDAESGNDYFGARYYSSAMGRFMSPDEAFADQHPDDPQTWNLYMYARNNPLHNVDPTGRGTASAIAWGILTGAASFAYHSTPIPGAVNAVRSLTRLATNPNAEIARMNAQSAHTRATITNTVKAIGSPEGRAGLVKAAGDAWNAQSTSEKAATVTQVVLAAGTVVAGGYAAGAGSAESSTTTLFRAVDPIEAQSITDTGAFLPSPNGTDFKGFFFDSSDAQSFGDRMSTLTGDQYGVVSGTAPTDLVDASPAHSAATEGSGVLINNQDLPQVKPQ